MPFVAQRIMLLSQTSDTELTKTVGLQFLFDLIVTVPWFFSLGISI